VSAALRQIVLDTETTGLEISQGNRIVEIGCVELRSRRVENELRWYLNPDRDSEPKALEVHGLTREFLNDKPRFPQVADDLAAFLRGAELVIHNANFDVGFLDREFELAGRAERIADICTVVDTIVLAKRLFPGQRTALDALCKRYNIDNSRRKLHGALLDARLLADVYLAMTGGQAALGLDAAASAGGVAVENLDWLGELLGANQAPLSVVRASEQEMAAHRERLAGIAKKSGKLVWSGELQ
jgi:DNA polymerase-3 subunit epsilon